jgi:Signal peptidase, peptidase S26
VNNVRDLMLRCRLRASSEGRLAFYATDGREVFVALLDPATGQAELRHNGRIVASAQAATSLPRANALLELSIVDRQFLLAIDERLVFEPYPYEPAALPQQPSTRPLAIGSLGADVEISELAVLRDIYYTRPIDGRWAIDTACTLGPEEYFVLGDNSPLSDDSRLWDESPAVPAEMLVGRPLFVHLPSRLWEVGNLTLQVPDLSKMRAIH